MHGNFSAFGGNMWVPCDTDVTLFCLAHFPFWKEELQRFAIEIQSEWKKLISRAMIKRSYNKFSMNCCGHISYRWTWEKDVSYLLNCQLPGRSKYKNPYGFHSLGSEQQPLQSRQSECSCLHKPTLKLKYQHPLHKRSHVPSTKNLHTQH